MLCQHVPTGRNCIEMLSPFSSLLVSSTRCFWFSDCRSHVLCKPITASTFGLELRAYYCSFFFFRRLGHWHSGSCMREFEVLPGWLDFNPWVMIWRKSIRQSRLDAFPMAIGRGGSKTCPQANRRKRWSQLIEIKEGRFQKFQSQHFMAGRGIRLSFKSEMFWKFFW